MHCRDLLLALSELFLEQASFLPALMLPLHLSLAPGLDLLSLPRQSLTLVSLL